MVVIIACFRCKMFVFLFFRKEKAQYQPHRRHDLESFVKMFYVMTMGDNEDFGIGTTNEERIKSALEYWRNFEIGAVDFWKEAISITRKIKQSASQDEAIKISSIGKVEELYNHIVNKFQLFKIEKQIS